MSLWRNQQANPKSGWENAGFARILSSFCLV
jgi:hypothetical protein